MAQQTRLQDNKKLRRILTIVGICLLVIGSVIAVIGIISSVQAFNAPGMQGFGMFYLIPIGLFTAFPGIPLIVVSNMGAIARFQAAQTVPVAGDATADLLNGPAGDSISGVIRNSRVESSSSYSASRSSSDSVKSKDSKSCPRCGEAIKADARFCERCGEKLS